MRENPDGTRDGKTACGLIVQEASTEFRHYWGDTGDRCDACNARFPESVPPPSYARLTEVARRYSDGRHYPRRECYGCGGSLSRDIDDPWASVMCSARGVDISGPFTRDRTYATHTLTWRQIRDLAGSPGEQLALF